MHSPERKTLVNSKQSKFDPIFDYRITQALKKAESDCLEYKKNNCAPEYVLELPVLDPLSCTSSRAACCWCFAISLAVSVVFVSLAYLFYDLATDTDELFDDSNGTITAAGAFFGWPEGESGIDLVKNLYGGMMLGLVFGFMDNFGLFYGMDALGDKSYEIALSITIGLMSMGNKLTEGEDESRLKADAHEVAESLLAGLGNTFSDVLGVALGSAALLISKSGLGQDSSFWPLDLLAIGIGCILGVILPAVAKYSSKLGSPRASFLYKVGSVTLMILVFTMVFLAGGTLDGYFFASASIFGVLIVVVIFFLFFTLCAGPSTKDFVSRGCVVSKCRRGQQNAPGLSRLPTKI